MLFSIPIKRFLIEIIKFLESVPNLDGHKKEEISKKYGIDFKRCDKCLVVRPPKVHHCSVCRGCIMRMDHHCPWINNCVGQFNQKFFILFCAYCFIGCGYANYITGYYLIYNNFAV